MITLTRSGLTLNFSEGLIPAEGSSDVPVQYINDTDEYKDYIVTPIAGWTQSNGLPKSSICEYADGIIKIPAGAFLQSGTISIAIQMTDPSNSSHIEATYSAVANVQKAPNASIILPSEDIWQKFISDYMNQYFDSEFDEPISELILKQQEQIAYIQNALDNNLFIGPQGPQGIQGPKGDKGDKGEKGDSGITAPTSGQFAFQVRDGHLYVLYADDANPPDFRINENGHLIMTI